MQDEELYVVFLQAFADTIRIENDIIGAEAKSDMNRYLINVHDYDMGTNHPFFGDCLAEAKRKCCVWLFKNFQEVMDREAISCADACYSYMFENSSEFNIHMSEDIVDIGSADYPTSCPRELLLLTQ